IRLTDAAAQQAHTGQSPEQAAAAIYTDRRSDTADAQAGYLNNRFDAEKVQNEIDLQRAVSQDFAPIAAQGVAVASDYLGSTQNYQHAQMLKNLLEAELRQNHSEAEKAELRADLNRINQYLADNQAAYELWKEGGIGRAILHAGAGGVLTGSADGALGAGAAALSAPHLEALGNRLGGTGKAVVDTLGAAAIGWMAGGTGGAVTGSNADWHNRQLHPDEIKLTTSREFVEAMKAQVRRVEGQDISDQEAIIRLQKQILRWVDKSSQDGYTDQVAMSVLPMSGRFKSNGFEYSWDYRQYDKHNPEAFNNPGRFAGHTTPAHRDRLSRSHAGRSNADIRQQAEANEALALNLVDTATSLIRTPAGGISVREWIRSFSQDATKLRGGAADPLLAGAGGGSGRTTPSPMDGEITGNHRPPVLTTKGIVGNNIPVSLPSNINTQVLKQALDKATPTGGHPNQLMYVLDDGTRVIFRKDFGNQAHPIGNIFQGKGNINHYNIEVQIPKANGGVRVIENLHIVPNSSGGFTWWGKDGVIRK
ncbi:hemagglutinin/hemolysin family protein, partial [Neisseria shayeganii 871]